MFFIIWRPTTRLVALELGKQNGFPMKIFIAFSPSLGDLLFSSLFTLDVLRLSLRGSRCDGELTQILFFVRVFTHISMLIACRLMCVATDQSGNQRTAEVFLRGHVIAIRASRFLNANSSQNPTTARLRNTSRLRMSLAISCRERE